MVDFEWYRSFIAIYKMGTLTKAAESLYTSQPGISLHLNALEAYIGKKLFERTSRKMIPTEEAKQLYNYTIDAIEHLEKAEQHFKKTSKKITPSINFGMCTETFQSILEPEIPKIEFNLVAKFGDHSELIKDLENGILDLVITPKVGSKNNPLIEYEAFSKEQILLVAGSATDINPVKKLIKNNDYKALEHSLKEKVWYSASNEMEHFSRFWYKNFNKRPDFKPNFILPNISSIIRSLEDKQGYAIVPDFLVNPSITSKKINRVWEGKKEVSNVLHFATKKDFQFKKEIKVIKDIFRRKMRAI